jgi:hypothetical protein
MQNQNARVLAVIAGTLVLLIAFVAYRARTFQYCVGYAERQPSSRLVDSNKPCSPQEEPMDWRDLWRVEGLRSKVKMLGRTTAEAFGLN